MKRIRAIRQTTAFLLAGVALLFASCGNQAAEADDAAMQSVVTFQAEDMTMIYSEKGNLSYRFETPLLERYELAREPYMEFRRGVDLVTYNDSTRLEESTLTANYAIFLEKTELWEAKGNVIATNDQGMKMETEQLFWNQKTGRIYSNVDSKFTQGTDVILAEGFESDEKFDDVIFRRPKGRVTVDTTPSAEPAGE